MDSEILKILKNLRLKLKRTATCSYFLCNIINKDDLDVFQEYLYNNIEGIILPDLECTYEEHMKDDDFKDHMYPAVWETRAYTDRMNWLNKHIKLLEENGH